MRRSLSFLHASLLFAGCIALSQPAWAQTTCLPWSGQLSLQTAVNQYTCVEIQAGVWTIPGPITMPSGHTLRGVNRDTAVVKATASNWPYSGTESVVQSVTNTPPTYF